MKASSEAFGDRLRRYRKRLGYSQTALAEKVGVTRRIIHYYETESKRHPGDLLPKLAESLQVSVAALLGAEENKPDGRTIDAKFWPKWEQLTPEDRKVVAKVADSLIEKNKLLQAQD